MSEMRNPVFLLAWGLPLVAVIASVLSLILTLGHPDTQLPEQYHWEGFQLDRDFTRAARAADLHANARLTGFGPGGRCEVRLHVDGTPPSSLVLLLAHATRSDLDQRVTLDRVSAAGGAADGAVTYSGACQEAAQGHWRLELIDAANGWAVRQSIRGSVREVTLDPVSGQNE